MKNYPIALKKATKEVKMTEERYMNPYLAGALLGLLLLTTIYISGRGLAHPGRLRVTPLPRSKCWHPEHAETAPFYQKYRASHGSGSPLMNWLVFEVIGVLIGAFLSGLVANRLTLKLEKGPRTPGAYASLPPWAVAYFGALARIGARLHQRCCPQWAWRCCQPGGILTMLAIFAGAFSLPFFSVRSGAERRRKWDRFFPTSSAPAST
jgi:hypothetical protein